jgi:hypothetical protein
MRAVGRLQRATALGVSVLALACGDPLGVSVVTLDVDGSIIVSPDEPEEFHVMAVNHGDERVVWGTGSSSCQLGLVVLDADGERHSIDFRMCTADLVEHGLDPGESRTETFLWDGRILVDQEPWSSLPPLQALPAGQYRVFGVAGDREQSAPLQVTVAQAIGATLDRLWMHWLF